MRSDRNEAVSVNDMPPKNNRYEILSPFSTPKELLSGGLYIVNLSHNLKK